MLRTSLAFSSSMTLQEHKERVVTDGDECGTSSYEDKREEEYIRKPGKNSCRMPTPLSSDPKN